MQSTKIESVDQYIAMFPPDRQKILQDLRATIRAAAPDATERIAYGMPTFFLNGNLVHFASQANHIGFYPTPAGIEAFAKELSRYETSKGAVRFPLDKPMPLKLVTKIVKYRVAENSKSSKAKSAKGKTTGTKTAKAKTAKKR